ncbi:MAG: alkaline phosphatase family protein, partial [Thermoanaerobaculia bacterium]
LLLPALLPARQPASAPWDGGRSGAGADRRLLWVGVDAFTWTRANPLVRAGRMPHLADLMARGSYDVLLSEATFRRSVGTTGYWSPVVWTTLATGVGAERHGIDDFIIRPPPDDQGPESPRRRPRGRPASSFHRRVPAFWSLYSHFGRTVGVVGWWASWPAEPVRGVMASSNLGLRGRAGKQEDRRAAPAWQGERERLTFPPEFIEVIVREIGLPDGAEDLLAEIGVPAAWSVADVERQATIESVLWQDELYLAIALRLLERERPSLTAVYFEGIDAVSHGFWLAGEDPSRLTAAQRTVDPARAAGVVDATYAAFDRWLGRLLAAAGPETTVVLCSDHGFQTIAEAGRLRADHSGLGALLVAGPGIRAGFDGLGLPARLAGLLDGRPRVVDVLPTLLYLQGLPIADDLEGRVLARFLTRRLRAGQPQYRVADYAAVQSPAVPATAPGEAEAEYRARLRALGYLD